MKKTFLTLLAVTLLMAVATAAFSSDGEILLFTDPMYASNAADTYGWPSYGNIHVMVVNRGDDTWTTADNYKLGSTHAWNNPFSDWVLGSRYEFPNGVSVAPGITYIFNLLGDYRNHNTGTMKFQMVHEGVAWIGESVAQETTVIDAPFNWDAYKDCFEQVDIAGNPTGSLDRGLWEFGYRNSSGFTRFDGGFDNNGNDGEDEKAFHKTGDWDSYGYVGRRRADGWSISHNRLRLPHMIFMGSTFDGGGRSTIRFTAPCKGKYYVEYMAVPIGQNENDTDIYLYKNGAQVAKDHLSASLFQNGLLVHENDSNRLHVVKTFEGVNRGDTFELMQVTGTPVNSCTSIPMFRILCENPTVYVRGNVKSSFGNANLKGATVSYGNTASATTDNNGNYAIEIPYSTSEQTLTASAGYHNSASIKVTPVQPTIDAPAASLKALCAVSGYVTSSFGGGAVNGATVTVAGQSATTDSRGYYSVTVDRAGSANVSASASGYDNYSGTVAPNADTVRKDIVLNAVCTVSGKVTSSFGGGAVSGITVTVAGKTATTDSNGNYSVKINRANSAAVTVNANGYQSYSGTVNASGATATQNIQLTAQCTVSGTVTSSYGGGAVSGATVTVGGKSATTGSDGKYSITINRANSASVTASATGYDNYSGTVAATGATATKNITLNATCVVSGKVTSSFGGNVSGVTVNVGGKTATTDANGNYSVTIDRANSANVSVNAAGYDNYSGTVAATGATATKNIELHAISVVSGRVVDLNGPVAGATVTMGNETTTTGSDGTFSFTVDRSSTPATVSVSAPNHNDGSATVTPNAAEVSTGDITLTTFSTITGKVVDAYGPISGATVTMGDESTTTDANGNYSFTVDISSTPATITATAPDHESGSVNVTPNATSVTAPDITLNALSTVTGKVVDADGPVAGATVTMGDETTTTDENGNYSFTVDRGSEPATITVTAPDHRDGSGTVTPNAAQVQAGDITLVATSTVSGTVTSSFDNSPVEGATVTIGNETATTDANGQYSVTVDRSDVDYDVTASATGYDNYTGSVTADAAAVTNDITLNAVSVITGKVVDADGPVEGATVTMGDQTTTTDANGEYTFTVDRGSEPETITVTAPDHRDGSTTVTPNAAEVTADDITLVATSTVSGTVTSSFDNSPVAGATVTIGEETTTTDANGQYTITVDRSDVDYDVTASADGFDNYTGSVTADSAEVTNDITLNAISVITGKVVDADGPVAGATVTMGDETTTTDENGEYTFTVDRDSEPETITVTAPDHRDATGTVTPNEAEVQADDIIMVATSTVTGTVTSSFDNSPVAGATVTIGEETTTTDANGQYTITVDRSDVDYDVTASATGYDNYTGSVTADAAAVTNDFVMNAVSVITGKVVDANGPVSGATVTMGDQTTTTDENGNYTFTVDRGSESETITVTAPGHRDGTGTVIPNAAQVQADDITLTITSTVTGTVTSSFGNTPVAGATVTIGNETTTTDENGQYTITVDSSAEDYNVSVTADGFTDYTGTVTANESEVSEDITLTERNTVKVTVTSSYDGSALEGATVTVGGTACEYEGNGVYTVEVDRADSYEVSVSKSGYTDKTITAPDNGKPTTVSAELNKLAENIVELINADDDTTLATGFDLVITSATGQFDGNVVYAQSEDRLHGVKLILNPEYGTVAVGNRVRLSGVITHEGTETVVTVTEPLIKNETGDEPITLGLVYKPITNDTLVRVWGHVTEVNGNTFTVNNVIGSFTCVAKPDSAPAVGDVVGVTGIATPQGILARTAADVKVHFVAN